MSKVQSACLEGGFVVGLRAPNYHAHRVGNVAGY